MSRLYQYSEISAIHQCFVIDVDFAIVTILLFLWIFWKETTETSHIPQIHNDISSS